MTIVQLRAFILAVELGTFTRAAHSLEMSQPAVSDLVRRLEEELGVQLFNRGKRELVLTDAGKQLLPHAEQAIAAVEAGARSVQSQLELRGGTASFGLLRNADYYLRSSLALRFHRQYPNVKVRLVGQNSAETAVDVAAGHLDAGLVSIPVADDGLQVVPLARDELLYVTSDSKLAGSKVEFAVLASEPHVLYDAHYGMSDPARKQIYEKAQLEGLELDPIIEVEYLNNALELVAAGVGGSIICKAAVASGVLPENVHAISFSEPLFDTLALVKREGLMLSPATCELAMLAWEILEQQQSTDEGTVEIFADRVQLRNFFAKP